MVHEDAKTQSKIDNMIWSLQMQKIRFIKTINDLNKMNLSKEQIEEIEKILLEYKECVKNKNK